MLTNVLISIIAYASASLLIGWLVGVWMSDGLGTRRSH